MEDHCSHRYSDYCAMLNKTVDDVLLKEGESRFKQHLKPHTKGLLRYIGNVLDPTLDSVIHQLSNLVRFFELKFSSHLRLHYLLCGIFMKSKWEGYVNRCCFHLCLCMAGQSEKVNLSALLWFFSEQLHRKCSHISSKVIKTHKWWHNNHFQN